MSDSTATALHGDRWAVGANGTERPGRRTPVLPWAIVAILAVAVGVLTVVVADLAGERDDLQEQIGDREAVAKVAGELTTALFTFDASDLDASREEVLALATGNLEDEYDEAFGLVGEQLAAQGASAEAVVTDVYVGEVGRETATAVTVMDLTIEAGAGPQRTFDNHLVLTLVRTTEGWRVDRVVTVGGSFDPSVPPPAPSG